MTHDGTMRLRLTGNPDDAALRGLLKVRSRSSMAARLATSSLGGSQLGLSFNLLKVQLLEAPRVVVTQSTVLTRV